MFYKYDVDIKWWWWWDYGSDDAKYNNVVDDEYSGNGNVDGNDKSDIYDGDDNVISSLISR